MTTFKKPIALIGLSGSGKTTLGKELAKTLNIDFLDTDEIISKKLKMKITDIFKTKGESFFRKQEYDVLHQMPTAKPDYILSTGGGIILNPDNLSFLLKNFIIIYIKCSPEVIAKRLSQDRSRPLLKDNPLEKLKFLFTQRQQFYNKAHIEIDTSNNNLEKTIKNILKALANFHET